MVDIEIVRQFFRRLNHRPYGLTELVAIDKDTGKITATGFFDNAHEFISACRSYNERCNMYAGRNPRHWDTSWLRNCMDELDIRRAKDKDIKLLTAVSLDIDPVREKGVPATSEQRERAYRFALNLQWDLGGDVDDSGNGVYLWISFTKPIELSPDNAGVIKKKCEMWQALLKKKYQPEGYGVRIDGCYDFSRLKRVIGTLNHKAQRISSLLFKGAGADDKVRNEILSIEVCENQLDNRKGLSAFPVEPSAVLPPTFERLLSWDISTRKLWENPDPLGDTSRHDWMLGLSCVEAGITEPEELAAVLINNPYGKYRRDGRRDYVERTARKLILQNNCFNPF